MKVNFQSNIFSNMIRCKCLKNQHAYAIKGDVAVIYGLIAQSAYQYNLLIKCSTSVYASVYGNILLIIP